MDAEIIKALMAEQLERVRDSALCRVFGWEISVDGLSAYVHMRPRRKPDTTYLLRASFEDFPRHAPSCVFVDVASRQPDDDAWPPKTRHGASPPGICTPGTREFHNHYHANDRQYPWSPDRYPFLQTLTEIHRLMEHGIGT